MDPVTVSIVLTTIGWLARPIFSKVADIAWKQFTKRVGLDAEIDNLITELKSFKVPVETAETIDYLKEVKELIYDVKDLLDELDYFRLQEEIKQMNKTERHNIFHRLTFSSQGDVPSSSMARTFKELKFDKKGMCSRIKDLIKKLKLTYESLNPRLQHQLLSVVAQSLQIVNNQALPTNQRNTTSYTFEDEIYGRDREIKQIKKLINHIEQHPQKFSVIAIVGNGGIGKTTLAQLVYNELTPLFSTKMWICVSTNLDGMGITRQILQCCSPNNVSFDKDSNEDFLKRKLEEYLKEKKFLLVLDDIWEMGETEWKSLIAPLKPHTATKTSRIVLVTTRDLSIAKMVSTTDPIYLDRLDDSNFWLFFLKCSFGDGGYNVPTVFKDIGRKIVEKLSGNPLAAKTVGNLLKGETNPIKWAEILDSEEWKFVQGKDYIMPTLRLSYEHLPIYLKQCFSFCSLFPKGHYFTAKELVYMWMAQDFISIDHKRENNFCKKRDTRVEDIGLYYLKTLVERAFIQKIVEKWDVVYVLHDLMHDLAQSVSSEEILAINRPINNGKLPSFNSHHLSFFVDVEHTIESCVQFQNMRSLVILKNNEALKDTLDWGQVDRISLRLLILPYERSISYNFSYFTHLRYLKLNWHGYDNERDAFPVQICKLYHLQVLELKGSGYYDKELPKEFNNLVNLRHFIAHRELHSKIAGVGRLKLLQELEKFSVREEKGFELDQLYELKELRGSLEICGLQNVRSREEAQHARLSEKNFVKLELYWDKETEDRSWQSSGSKVKWMTCLNREGSEWKTTNASSEEILEALRPNSELRDLCINNYGGCNSPSWLSDHSIKYLETIELSDCEVWEELPNFGQLIFLKELYLNKLSRVKEFGPQFHRCGCGPPEGFPSLKVMDVHDMDKLETWDWGQQYKVFPSLERLLVSDCPRLREFSFFNLISVRGHDTEWFAKLDYLRIANCHHLQQVPPLFGVTKAEIVDLGFGSIFYSRPSNSFSIYRVEVPGVFDIIFMTFKNIRSVEITLGPITSLSWKYICMLHSLKTLEFRLCPKLHFSPNEKEKDDGRTLYSHESLEELKIYFSSVNGEELSYLLAHLPAIRKLSIENCKDIGSVSLPNIINEPNKPYLEAKDKVDKDQHRIPNSLACLEELLIKNCPNMVFVNEGGLSRLSALKKITIMQQSEKLLSSMYQKEESNSVLTLTVSYCSKLTSLKLYNFVVLKELELSTCKNLAAVEGPNLPAYPEVLIRSCPMLAKMQNQIKPKFIMPIEKLDIDNIEFLSFHAKSVSMSLRSLTITVEHFFSGKDKVFQGDIVHTLCFWREWTKEQEDVLIQHLTSLEELTLHCKYLCSLPSAFYLHRSLKKLFIHKCPEIKSLPQRGLPKSLQELRLSRCCSEELIGQCSQLENFESSIETNENKEYYVFVKKERSFN